MAKDNDIDFDINNLKLQFRVSTKKGDDTTVEHTYWLVTDENSKPIIEYHGMPSSSSPPHTKICKHLHSLALGMGDRHMILCDSQYQVEQPYRVVATGPDVLNIINKFNILEFIWNIRDIKYNPTNPTTHESTNMEANANTAAYTLGVHSDIKPENMIPFDNHNTPGLYDLRPFLFPGDFPVTTTGENGSTESHD